jgi:hypothetical protein
MSNGYGAIVIGDSAAGRDEVVLIVVVRAAASLVVIVPMFMLLSIASHLSIQRPRHGERCNIASESKNPRIRSASLDLCMSGPTRARIVTRRCGARADAFCCSPICPLMTQSGHVRDDGCETFRNRGSLHSLNSRLGQLTSQGDFE